MNDQLREITRRVENMPVVSETPYRLLQLVERDDYAIAEIIKIVETDVSLTTRCLTVVNSAAFGLPRTINSIRQAVVFLGSRMLVKLAMTQAFKSFFQISMVGYGAKPGEFWEHSVRTAVGARLVAQELIPDVAPDLAYTAGLLHDMGKAVISEFLEKHQQHLLTEMQRQESGDFLEIERRVLGTDHTRVGEAMAEKWRLPESLQMVIRYHHHPSLVSNGFGGLIQAAHLADLLAMIGGAGTGLDTLAYQFDEKLKQKLKLDRQILADLVYKSDMEFLTLRKKFDF
ncbi:MAG: HDOD domain-containing protein [Calditrichia bacterium]